MKESTRHRRALNLYIRLGGGRSLEALHEAIEDDPAQVGLSRAPTLRTLESWSAIPACGTGAASIVCSCGTVMPKSC